jgi:hypothetical protein
MIFQVNTLLKSEMMDVKNAWHYVHAFRNFFFWRDRTVRAVSECFLFNRDVLPERLMLPMGMH